MDGPARDLDRDLARMVAFCRWLEDSTAERIELWTFGSALFNDTYPLRWDSNFLRIEQPLGDADAVMLAREADRLLSGVTHRNLVVEDAADGAKVAPGFAGLGWEADHHVYMVSRRERDRASEERAEEVPFDDVAPVIFESHLAREGMPRETAEMLTRFSGEQAESRGTRYFTVRVDGVPAAYCELYLHDGVAQIEDVNTLERFRGRGLARAVVSLATDEARAGGAEMVFLIADQNDWPKELYRKLGFDPAGHVWVFVLPPEGERRS